VGKKRKSTKETESLDADTAALDLLDSAPRLIKVTFVTVISFALWDGANRAITRERRYTDDAREITAGYRGDCGLMTVLRLALLLDADPNVLSYQRIYRHLKRREVVEALIVRVRTTSTRSRSDIEYDVERFLRIYRSIDWELHGRLIHFRNRGVAHLTPERIDRWVKYGELKSLTSLVANLGECLEPFGDDAIPATKYELKDYTDRASKLWQAGLRASHKGRLKLINKGMS
jgi:hypothetical protein